MHEIVVVSLPDNLEISLTKKCANGIKYNVYLLFTQEFYFMLTGLQHTIFTEQFFAARHFMCHNEGHFTETVIIMDFRA